MKTLVSVLALVALARVSFATTLIVDKNGGGQFTSIQGAINFASPYDTVKVYPGRFDEQITLNKDIVLMGSGYENTIIVSATDPTVTMGAGKMQWFQISSTTGNGVNIIGGTLRNVVVIGCARYGIYSGNISTSGATVFNSVMYQNGSTGIRCNANIALNVINCISFGNSGSGYDGYVSGGWMSPTMIALSYSCGSQSYTGGNQGCIDQNPLFASPPGDFHISAGSPGWNTGHPSYTDPDGSRSDMGYFGGPECPIYPTVFEILISPSGNTVRLTAKARANY